MENSNAKKGVKTKLFGVILIFLGVLDSMLAWRGGFAVNTSYIWLIVFGIFLYAIGTIRCGRQMQ